MTSKRARVLDAVERLLVLVLYFWLVVRLCVGFRGEGGFANLLLLPSEGLILVFVLLRRRTEDVSQRPLDWLLTIAATSAPMLVTQGHAEPIVPAPIAGAILLMGMVVQLHAKLSLGKSFGCVPANRGLKVGGPYKLVRHPIYAGYMVSHLGFLLLNPLAWNLAMYAICDVLQIPRLLAEERLLSRDEAYRRYQATVRYRLLPGIF